MAARVFVRYHGPALARLAMNMTKENLFPVGDDDIYALTARGEAQVKSGETGLEPLALQMLVLIDGRRPVKEIRRHVSAARDEVERAIGGLLRDGMICPATAVKSDAIEFDFSGFASFAPTSGSDAHTKESETGVASLREHGYFVRIARRPANAPALPTDRKPVVVVVEDEPQLAKFMGHLLGFEGFEVRTAGNREQVVQALRAPPLPDLILLDVMLPDIDGFEILANVRQYPALQQVPVIMITAKATREAVLRGLSGGADGYITKPFQPEVLTKAIRTMFGVVQPQDPKDIWKHDV